MKGQHPRRWQLPSEVFSQGNITRLLTASDSSRSHPSRSNFKPQPQSASRCGYSLSRKFDAGRNAGED